MTQANYIGFLYAVFAVLAMIINLVSQAMVIEVYQGSYAVEISMVVGTAVSLPVKYLLDKRYIYCFEVEDFTHESKVFILYFFMSIFTTLLFWGVEYAFHRFFEIGAMRYLGGAIGLVAGYVIKYRLDKRFVFVAKVQANMETP